VNHTSYPQRDQCCLGLQLHQNACWQTNHFGASTTPRCTFHALRSCHANATQLHPKEAFKHAPEWKYGIVVPAGSPIVLCANVAASQKNREKQTDRLSVLSEHQIHHMLLSYIFDAWINICASPKDQRRVRQVCRLKHLHHSQLSCSSPTNNAEQNGNKQAYYRI